MPAKLQVSSLSSRPHDEGAPTRGGSGELPLLDHIQAASGSSLPPFPAPSHLSNPYRTPFLASVRAGKVSLPLVTLCRYVFFILLLSRRRSTLGPPVMVKG